LPEIGGLLAACCPAEPLSGCAQVKNNEVIAVKKILLLSTALTLGTLSASYAGGLAEPVLEPEMAPAVIEEATSSSSGGIIVAVLLLLLIAAAASGSSTPPPAPSDIRLKEDITRVGTNHLGLPVYTFRYKGLPEVWEGVMAQDVEIMHPNAVRPIGYGFKGVDYARLGLSLKRVH
jgi:hypothetical protein